MLLCLAGSILQASCALTQQAAGTHLPARPARLVQLTVQPLLALQLLLKHSLPTCQDGLHQALSEISKVSMQQLQATPSPNALFSH